MAVKEHLYFSLLTYWLVDQKSVVFVTFFELAVFTAVLTHQTFALSSNLLIQEYQRHVTTTFH
jgi:hypothetical protein